MASLNRREGARPPTFNNADSYSIEYLANGLASRPKFIVHPAQNSDITCTHPPARRRVSPLRSAARRGGAELKDVLETEGVDLLLPVRHVYHAHLERWNKKNNKGNVLGQSVGRWRQKGVGRLD